MSQEFETTPPPELPDDDVPPKSPTLIARLFLFPLALVLVCVGVFVLFGLLAADEKSPQEYLEVLRTAGPHGRGQAAYELAQLLARDKAAGKDPALIQDMVRVLRESRDVPVRQFLALALGSLREPAAVPALVEALDAPENDVRFYAAVALGQIEDAQAVPPLVARAQDDDPGVRKIVIRALGAIGDPAALECLKISLNDRVDDVRWNGAIALAEMGDPAGVPVLTGMLDRDYLQRQPQMTPEQQDTAMLSAIAALGRLQAESARPTLERLASRDPSLKVQQAARDALGILSATPRQTS